MNRDNKSDYFIGVGSTINTIRFIGPFNRLVLAKKFYKRNEGDPAFNPHKEIVQIYKVITPKKFLEESIGYQINRVRLFDWLLTPKYHKLLSCMDIILDSYPFGGCNTSLDAFNFNKIV